MENFSYCRYKFDYPLDLETPKGIGCDYDQFALINNSLPFYIRLCQKKGSCHYPCGLGHFPSSDGEYARSTPEEKDKIHPKIAWGFSAYLLSKLYYDDEQEDYVLTAKNINIDYYRTWLPHYLSTRTGLKYRKLSEEDKEMSFIKEHIIREKELWRKSNTLKKYSELYTFAKDMQSEYIQFLTNRLGELAPETKNNHKLKYEVIPKVNTVQLGDYFKSIFKGMGNRQINHFEILTKELEKKRTAKEIGKIALMIYNGSQMNHRKPKSFAKWHRIFCDCLGLEYTSYRRSVLQNPEQALKSLFNYLE